jgi:hypothetical protein
MEEPILIPSTSNDYIAQQPLRKGRGKQSGSPHASDRWVSFLNLAYVPVLLHGDGFVAPLKDMPDARL